MSRSWIILVVTLVGMVNCEQNKTLILSQHDLEDPDEFFKSLFLKDSVSGNNAFHDWTNSIKKGLTKTILSPKPDEKQQSKQEEEAKKEKENIPIPAKVFAFYGKSYGCRRSKVYEEFLKAYKEGRLPQPKNKPEVDESWLKKLAEKEAGSSDGSANITVKEAEAKISKLTPEQIDVLNKGETEMPADAQFFMQFVKSKGCEDKTLPTYKKFNDKLKTEFTKHEGKNYKYSYYLSKVITILGDEF